MLNIKNTIDGFLKDVEIKGNTIQDASNLADIRSVGDKIEGQELYKIPVISYGKNLFNKEKVIKGKYQNYNGSNVILNYSASDNVVYYVEDNNVTMIGSEIERFSLAKALKKLKINKVDNIVAFDLSLNNLSNLKEIIKDYGIQKVYIKNSNNWEGLKELIPQFEFYSNSINIGKLKLNFFDDKNKSYYFEVENIGKFLNVNNESVIIENDLHLIYKDIDYLIIPYMFNENILDSFNVRKYFCNKTTEVQKDSLLNMKIYDKIILSEV